METFGSDLVPEKSPVMLRPTKGERKQVEREALGEDGGEEVVGVLLGLVVREAAVVDSNTRLWSTTVDTAAVVLDCGEREKRQSEAK